MKVIKFGIFGLYRGSSYFRAVLQNNGTVVAVCDKDEKRLACAKEKISPDLATYTDFEEFINHPGLDAVFLCNYFDQHAPFAIRALEKGLHVLSECTAASTMAESVALVRAVEKSGKIYMLAENYPYMKFNLEMKRLYESGNFGKCLYAEGEYNHPLSPLRREYIKSLRPHEKHWRNYTPRSYYITHSLGPLMYMTGGSPKRVTATPVYAPNSHDPLFGYNIADRAAIITCLNDDDSVYRIVGCSAFGGHGNYYRICGTKGQMENLKDGSGRVAYLYNDWEIPDGYEEKGCYEPEWHDKDEELIKESGHGGGDFLVIRNFFEGIRLGKQPFFDVYRSTAMASVAILAHRSILEGGKPFDIPDFHRESDRQAYENDTLTPFYGINGEEPTLPCCSHTDYNPSKPMIDDYDALLREEY